VLRVAPEMPDTASSVFVVAFQIGIGGGALAGSGLLGSGHLSAIPQLALVLFVAGSAVAAAARRTFGGDDPAPPRPRSARPPGRTRRRYGYHPAGARPRRSPARDRGAPSQR
jgi:hypothetical protein